MSKNLHLARKYLFFFILYNFSFTTLNYAQSVTGNTTDLSLVPGNSVIVDDALTISYAGSIVNASVMIATNYQDGDMLSIDDAMLPAGSSSSFNNITGRLTLTGTGTAAQWQAALRTVQFTASSGAYNTKQVSFILGNALYYPPNGHYYDLITPGMTWTEGKEAAASLSLFGLVGYLATITDNAENDFISTKLQTDGWIGCSDDYLQINAATGTTTYADQAASEGSWYWVCGPEKGTLFSEGNDGPVPVTFARWNGGEPNNQGGENYGEMYSGNRSWNDLPNGAVLPLLVEYGGTPGDPVIDISHTRNIEILLPTLSGNAITQAYFTNDGQSFPVDPTVHFSNAVTITDVTISISGGYTQDDFIDIDENLVPPGVYNYYYDSFLGTWFFRGTATTDEWKLLMASVTFRTTSADLSNRTVTFNVGNEAASPEGHFYRLSDFERFDYNTMTHFVEYFRHDMAIYNGLQGYNVNISSAQENDFLKKFHSDFWLPLTDDHNLLNQMLGNYPYMEQSETEGNFYWLGGLAAGTLLSTGNASLLPEPGQYNAWADSEPSNIRDNEFDPDYGNSVYFSSIDGKWYNDKLGSQQRQVLIEYGGSPGDPPVTTVFTKTMSILGVLPVTLTKFGVKMVGKTVLAEWQTSAEKNNSYFNLERSSNNNNFTTIGRVEGGGTTGYTRNYHFTDLQPLTGINYYRLKQVDIDNHFVYSPISKVDFRLQDKHSQIYPTLVASNFTVQMANPGKAQCFIINAGGSVVQRIIPAGAVFTVNVNTLPKGAYIFRIISSENGRKEENLRFIKN